MKLRTFKACALLITLLVLNFIFSSCSGCGGSGGGGGKSGGDVNTQWRAWSENFGWVTLQPDQIGGITIHDDHLSGTAWSENIGWINLGNHTDDADGPYDNNSADNWGVNRDLVTGEISGYAWSETTGWVNFRPNNGIGGVTYDADTEELTGFAWSENAGWIHFDFTIQ